MIKEFIEKLFWRYHEIDLTSYGFTKEEADIIFKDLSENEDLINLLKSIAKNDKERYFRASKDKTRDTIKGQYIRILYLIRKIMVEKQVEGSKPKAKDFGGRYGK